MAKDSLTITDNRTGKTYEIPIENGTIRALDLRQIKVDEGDFGLMTYDPAFTNTASCKSRITFIDGDQGILNYRGYPIEQLAEKSNYLETAYLIVHGELPSKAEYDRWVYNITHHTIVHENIKELMGAFRYDAHPMGMLASVVAALSTFYPEAKDVRDAKVRHNQIFRLIAKIPTLAAFAYRHSAGLPYVYPDNDLSYCGNFLQMMFRVGNRYEVNPVLERALEVLFILHADHEQNCSTSAMRQVGSSEADPYSSMAAAIAALYGPLHGGANEQVLRMLEEIGSKDKVPQFIKEVKTSGGDVRLMGFGHRVYKNYDPARQDHQEDGRPGLRGHRPQPPPRHRPRARADRPRGRVLRQAEALPERGLLLGPHLPGHGLPRGHVPGALRDPAHVRLARPVGRDARGQGAEDRPPAPDLPGPPEAGLRASRSPLALPRSLFSINIYTVRRSRGRPAPGGSTMPMTSRGSTDAADSRDRVEAGVEAHHIGHLVALHHGDVKRVACGQPRVSQQQVLRPLDVVPRDREDLVHNADQGVAVKHVSFVGRERCPRERP